MKDMNTKKRDIYILAVAVLYWLVVVSVRVHLGSG